MEGKKNESNTSPPAPLPGRGKKFGSVFGIGFSAAGAGVADLKDQVDDGKTGDDEFEGPIDDAHGGEADGAAGQQWYAHDFPVKRRLDAMQHCRSSLCQCG